MNDGPTILPYMLNIPGRNDIHHSSPDAIVVDPSFPILHPVPPVTLRLIYTVEHHPVGFEHHHRRAHRQVGKVREIGLRARCQPIDIVH